MKRAFFELAATFAASSAFAQSDMQRFWKCTFLPPTSAMTASSRGRMHIRARRVAAHFDEIDTTHQEYVTLMQVKVRRTACVIDV